MTERLLVLLVDDDPQVASVLRDILERGGYATAIARSAAEAIAISKSSDPPPAIAVVDLALPDMDGIDLVPHLQAASSLTEIIILTGNASIESAIRALRENSFDYLTKPVDPRILLDCIERAAERWRRKVAEATLDESERRLGRLFHAIGDAMFITGKGGGCILDANPAALRLTGYGLEELQSRTLHSILEGTLGDTGEGSLPIDEAVEGGIGEYFLNTAGGQTLRVEVRTTNLTEDQLIHTARDQTERRRIEEQVHRAERMEVVGRLAGGIAHDFNNVLTAIVGYAELLTADLRGNTEAVESLQEILQAANRAGRLTRELLAFSRRQIFQPKVLDLNAVVADVEKMLRRLIRGDVELTLSLGSDLGTIRADRGQLEEVLVNLVVNASDAMPEGGRLTVATQRSIIPPGGNPILPFEMPPGDYLTLVISDTGEGMGPATLARVFEPFFTTKAPGKGTGLGLATAYGIVKQSGGFIHAESVLGEGSQFTIFLPRYALDPDELFPGGAGSPPARGTETILVAEDDRTVRTFVRRALELHGYAVLEAASATEAIQVVRGFGGPIHLLLTDLLIPGASRHGLAGEIATLRPETKVILSTGHSREMTDFGDIRGFGGILEKPYTIEVLLREVRRVLDGVAR